MMQESALVLRVSFNDSPQRVSPQRVFNFNDYPCYNNKSGAKRCILSIDSNCAVSVSSEAGQASKGV
jgi:hypothetical protein